MLPAHIWLAYTAACLLLAIAPGPDNLLAVGPGLSQAACISGSSSGMGILFHSVAAVLGLSVLMQTSALAFWIIKSVYFMMPDMKMVLMRLRWTRWQTT